MLSFGHFYPHIGLFNWEEEGNQEYGAMLFLGCVT